MNPEVFAKVVDCLGKGDLAAALKILIPTATPYHLALVNNVQDVRLNDGKVDVTQNSAVETTVNQLKTGTPGAADDMKIFLQKSLSFNVKSTDETVEVNSFNGLARAKPIMVGNDTISYLAGRMRRASAETDRAGNTLVEVSGDRNDTLRRVVARLGAGGLVPNSKLLISSNLFDTPLVEFDVDSTGTPNWKPVIDQLIRKSTKPLRDLAEQTTNVAEALNPWNFIQR